MGGCASSLMPVAPPALAPPPQPVAAGDVAVARTEAAAPAPATAAPAAASVRTSVIVVASAVAATSPPAPPVSVVVRVRPLAARERAAGATTVTDIAGSSVRLMGTSGGGATRDPTFAFDAALDVSASQADTYAVTAARLLPSILAGMNVSIFAYGQTGSGKTYTMLGAPGQDGVIPRLCNELFARLAAIDEATTSWSVEASYIEVYNERLRDLLAAASPGAGAVGGAGAVASDAAAGEPVIRESRTGVIVVEGARTRAVRSYADVEALLAEGAGRRTVGETAANAVSSRSHAVLTLRLSQRRADDDLGLTTTTSKLSLIDLAGSERSDVAGTTGARLREGANINRSLSTLGNVVAALTTPGRSHVPYRDSKLTRLLQDSLGGNAYIMMICCLSPAAAAYDESLSSLRFAERVKKVRNAPRVNRDPAAERVASLLAENAVLRRHAAALIGFLERRGLRGDFLAGQEAAGAGTDATVLASLFPLREPELLPELPPGSDAPAPVPAVAVPPPPPTVAPARGLQCCSAAVPAV